MKYILIVMLFLTGCATVGQRQGKCESQHEKFEDVVECTRAASKSDPRIKNHAGYKLYFLKGDQLSQQIINNEISELDARVEWQNLYVQIKGANDRKVNAAIRDYNNSRTKTTNCVPIGNSVSCTTQ